MTPNLNTLSQTQLERLTTLMVQGGHLTHPLRLQAHVETDASPDQLKAELAAILPAHMIPESIVTTPALPRLPNGKLDRSALVCDDEPTKQTLTNADNPASLETLRCIWADVLGMDQIYDEDNFFELGGDSLLSISVVSRARAEGLNLIPSDLFDYTSLAELATRTQPAEPQETLNDVTAQPLEARAEGEATKQMFILNANRRMLELLNDQLETRRLIHLLTLHWDSGKVGRSASVADIAEEFSARIRAIQPVGPYRLGGFSMGAVVAHEIARQLTAQGQTVLDLVMIDPPENQALFGSAFNSEHSFKGHKEDRWSLKRKLSNAALVALMKMSGAFGLKISNRFNSRIAASAYVKAAGRYKIKPPVIAPIIVRREIPPQTTLWANPDKLAALHQISCSHHDFHRDEPTIRHWTGLLAQSLDAPSP